MGAKLTAEIVNDELCAGRILVTPDWGMNLLLGWSYFKVYRGKRVLKQSAG
jgi:hypothetical protein